MEFQSELMSHVSLVHSKSSVSQRASLFTPHFILTITVPSLRSLKVSRNIGMGSLGSVMLSRSIIIATLF